MQLLITGGLGYIGSHTVVELLNNNHEVVIVDNLINSKITVLDRLQKITGKKPVFYQIDLLDKTKLDEVFVKHQYDGVIHFAGLKAVGESVQKPLAYYHNNLTGTLHLLQAMQKYSVKNLVFSSSACVYGLPASVPITENFSLHPENPYGQTKAMIEQILQDLAVSNKSFNIAILRYFNPIGAHTSGLIGEDPQGIPNNLAPFVAQVAVGRLAKLSIFGNDYETVDGTAIRDYIHVVDLAIGHIKALEKLNQNPGLVVYNLGTGKGISVLEMVKSFEKASGLTIPYVFAPRRPGDVPVNYAECSKAEKELNWKATKSIDDMCADIWRWQSQNPNGYPDK